MSGNEWLNSSNQIEVVKHVESSLRTAKHLCMYCNATSKIQTMKTKAKLFASVGIKWVRTKKYSLIFDFPNLETFYIFIDPNRLWKDYITDFPNSHKLWHWLQEGFMYIMMQLTKMFSVFVDSLMSLILTASAAVRTLLILNCQTF